MKKDSLFNRGHFKQLSALVRKREKNVDHTGFPRLVRVGSEQITDQNIKYKAMKLIEENMCAPWKEQRCQQDEEISHRLEDNWKTTTNHTQ